ncbi:hypothetical protein OIU34_34855 [Pararhizobium sp. BT-229]|uniref:hypothetical protein n=1 Tax=Pararhizobium sp. BT-229 TaxID=2986923 RepID=UPI0021F6C745|nr:hypothetical protein [Pararhizobium sp. BT-229]MCV9967015.1 hypothetical protein [Pararhizobium sp. BT-229]
MNDHNIIKFRKPEKQPRTVTPGTKKALAWLASIAALVVVWSYYQFIAIPS